MALKTLLLRRSIDRKKRELDTLRQKNASFATREAELEAAIAEAETKEQETAVNEAIEAFNGEKSAHEAAVQALEDGIAALETDLAAAEAAEPAAPDAAHTDRSNNIVHERTKFFNMTMQERDAFIGRQSIKDLLQRVRELGHQTRSVTGAEVTIPTDALDLIRENIGTSSKLYKHLRVRRVNGKARQSVMGAVPEAVWTEACASLKELTLDFSGVEVDGYKVGGYIAICKATLEDSDVALAYEILSAIAQGIGLGVDKASAYGTGVKMPLGIVTRLAQTTKPENYPAQAREWVNLSASNIITIPAEKTGVALFQELIKAAGKAKGKHSRGAKFWAMNETTKNTLISEALTFNAAGAIHSGFNNVMPVIGGAIEELEFIPDNVILGGYGDLYLLVERAGATLARSDECMFVEDNTVFKGTARYDGQPVIAEGFVAIGIGGTTPTSEMTFAGME